MPGRTGSIHRRSPIAGADRMIETNLAPWRFSLSSPILIGLLEWSSATPHSTKYFARSQSGAPNSQNECRSCYKRRPPCSPNRSRRAPPVRCPELLRPQAAERLHLVGPVKNASFRGSVARMRFRRSAGSRAPGPIRSRRTTPPARGAGLAQQRLSQLRRDSCFMMRRSPWRTARLGHRMIAIPWMNRI